MMLEEGRAVAKPVLAVMQDSNASFRIADGVPTFLDVEDAVNALGSLQGFEHWRETLADDPEPPEVVDVEGIERIINAALERGEQHLADRDARALLAAAGLPLQAIPAAGLVGRGCTLTLVMDPQFGPVCGVGVADPIAAVLDDIVYRLAPMHPNHAADAVASMRAFPLVGGQQLAAAYAGYLYQLSWLPQWAPAISLVSLADLRFVGDQRSASVSITLDPNPQVFDPRMRRMAG